MLDALETGIGLDLILWLQEHRTGWMEALSVFLSEFGYDLGYVALFGFIFWAINKRHGIRLVFALIAVALVTFALKDLLARPRPYIASDLVQPVFEAEGFGLPSGHTSFAVMIWTYIALWVRKAWMWVFAITYMILAGLARMVAGVHYPQDVVLGVVVGLVTLAIFYPVAARWEQFWRRQSLALQISLSVIIPLLMTGFILLLTLTQEQVEAYMTMLGLAMGVGIGAALEPRWINFEPHAETWRRGVLFVLGGVLIVLILMGLGPVFDLIAETGIVAYGLRILRYGLTGWAAITVVPWIGIQLGLATRESSPAAPIGSTG